MLTLTERLMRLSDTYCATVRRSRSRISAVIFGDGMRLDGVASGKDLNTRSYERAVLWFASNWPEGLAWPEGVERPAQVEAGRGAGTDSEAAA